MSNAPLSSGGECLIVQSKVKAVKLFFHHLAIRCLKEYGNWQQIWGFCDQKSKDIPELSDVNSMADLAFAVDVTALLN